MRRSRFSGPVALIAGVVLVLSGCVPTAQVPRVPAIDADALASVEQLRSLPFDESKVAIVTDALRAAGVAVADTWDPDAPEVVRITSWQAQNMAAEAANGGGMTGAELEAASPTPEGAAPIGYLISAWAIDYDSDAARLAHALLGEQDFHHPESILFPSLVTSLFLADATAGIDAADHPIEQAAGDSGSNTIAAGWVAFSSVAAAAPCSAVSNFIQSAIATVFNALTVDTSGGGLLGFLGKIWNTVVNLAFDFVLGLVKVVTQPIVNLIVTVLSVVETIRQVSTYLVAWRSTLEPDPETNRFGVDSERVQGALTLTVLDNRLPVPAAVLDCADQFGVDVRGAGSSAGSTIAWTPTNMARADLSVLDTASAIIDDDQKAEYHYITGQESKKAAEGDEHAGLLKLVSSVHRNDIERVRKLFTALVFDQIPASIRGIVEGIAGPLLDAATNHLTSITDVRATGYVAITFHGEKPPEEEPKPVESTSEAKTWLGQWQSDKYEDAGTFTLLIVIADGKMNGSIDIANSPCASSGNITGVADAGSVTFGSVEAGNEIQFQGTISADGTRMQGTYSDGTACGDDVGSWLARRTN